MGCPKELRISCRKELTADGWAVLTGANCGHIGWGGRNLNGLEAWEGQGCYTVWPRGFSVEEFMSRGKC